MNAIDTAQPLRVVLGVLTFKRPEGISKLLETMREQAHHPDRPYALTVVVVDNDATGSSRDVVGRFAGEDAYHLIYTVEQRQGIPIARNHALDAAPEDTDLFCFLDDDEWPVPGWLDAMLEVRARTGADCIYGPVEPAYAIPPTPWIEKSRLFERKSHADGAVLDYAASNNVMIDLRRVRALGLRFDERMRFTGGSDYLFFNQAHRRGIRIRWAEKALVYDIIPAGRMTRDWLLRRQYRLGNTFAVATQLEGSRPEKVKQFARGVARIGLGAAMSPAMLVSSYWGARALVHLLRGAGIAVGMLGHAYQEYAPEKLAAQAKPPAAGSS